MVQFEHDPPEDPYAEASWEVLRELAPALQAARASALSEFGLTDRQAQVLECIGSSTLKMYEICRVVGTSSSNLTNIVDRLIARGLAERGVAANSMRFVRLSTVGLRTASVFENRQALAIPAGVRALTDADHAHLRRIVGRILEVNRKASEERALAEQRRAADRVWFAVTDFWNPRLAPR